MTATFAALVAYSAQVLVVIVAAGIADRVLGFTAAHARLVYWRVVLAGCLVLPMLAHESVSGSTSVVFERADRVPDISIAQAQAAAPSWPFSVALWVVAVGIGLHVGRLAVGTRQLQRLRARSTPAILGDDVESLRRALAPAAELRWTHDLRQPAAFGLTRPVVLLPSSLGDLSASAQLAVICHELAHVARRDWPWIVAESHVRALFWFHPAVRWLLDQMHLSREQVVDRFVVARTGARKEYMHALLSLSDAAPPVVPAMGFLRRHHLVARLARLSQEEVQMTRQRVLVSVGVLTVVLVAVTRSVMAMMPLNLPALGDEQAGSVRLELRLAELTPATGLADAVVNGSGQRIYLHPDVIVGTTDVISARVREASKGRYSVSAEFSASASARLTVATQAHLGRPVAILLDGRVLAAPIVRSPIGRSAILTGDFTKERADAIAVGLMAGKTVAAAPAAGLQNAGADVVSGDDPEVTLPEVITKTTAFYTEAARNAGIEGLVELTGVVMPNGTVEEITVTESLDTLYGLDQSAMESLGFWRFKPGTKGGEVVPVRVTFWIRFTLS